MRVLLKNIKMFALKFVRLNCLDESEHKHNNKEEKKIETNREYKEITSFALEKWWHMLSEEMAVRQLL